MKNKIESYNFFSKLYTDKETERLSDEYDISSCPDNSLSMTLGQTEAEIGAYKLLSLSKCFGKFVGIKQKDLDKISCFESNNFYYVGYLDDKYVRTAKKGKLEILFPTEELLINQKVRKK